MNEYVTGLVHELVKSPNETPWLELKRNNANPQEIGKYISALANSAALHDKNHAYILWGIDDATHDIVGTTFVPETARKGNEPLESWLLRLLTPKIHFRFFGVEIDSKTVVLLEIDQASHSPVAFEGTEYIRVGQTTKPLRENVELERRLWRIFNTTHLEELVAAEHQSVDEVLRLLDYRAYFDLLQQPLPTNSGGVLAALSNDRLIRECPAGG